MLAPMINLATHPGCRRRRIKPIPAAIFSAIATKAFPQTKRIQRRSLIDDFLGGIDILAPLSWGFARNSFRVPAFAHPNGGPHLMVISRSSTAFGLVPRPPTRTHPLPTEIQSNRWDTGIWLDGCLMWIAFVVVGAIGWADGPDPSAPSRNANAATRRADHDFYEKHIRPLLVARCYECHSESERTSMGGLLLDRRSGWIEGGDTGQAIVPGQVDESLLIQAVRYGDDLYQMPPDGKLADDEIKLLEQWVRRGAPGSVTDVGQTEFSRLGDQDYLFSKAKDHWAFAPIAKPTPPRRARRSGWNRSPIDRFVLDSMRRAGLGPSRRADPDDLLKRLVHDLTGLAPTFDEVESFKQDLAASSDDDAVIRRVIDRLLVSPRFGEHWGSLWLDIARYADTDSNYRPDTRTPHYYPFAFAYRDYVIDAINQDKPYDVFLKEQFAADLMETNQDESNLAALGFFAVGPHRSRAPLEALDDWIDLATRGLMGITVACARCHDHKFEPVPTTDYYALRGIFNSIERSNPLELSDMAPAQHFVSTASERADYQAQAARVTRRIDEAGDQKAKGNNRPVATKILETELAQLMLFHPGAPAKSMIIRDKRKPVPSFVAIRGDLGVRGQNVGRRFLSILDPEQIPFPESNSGRLELAEAIASPENPLTARVWVNRVWGKLLGSYIVATPSDFGLQSSDPTHPRLLDHLAFNFMQQGWSTKQLIRSIVTSRTYQQSCDTSVEAVQLDPENRWLARANRKRLSIEAIRDRALSVSGQMDGSMFGRSGLLWPDPGGEVATGKAALATNRRTLYGFVNRFNLDPNLRTFDFPSRMASVDQRATSIVAPQSLFLLNSSFIIEQADTLVNHDGFKACNDDLARVEFLFRAVLARLPAAYEAQRIQSYLQRHQAFVGRVKASPRMRDQPWPLIAQSLFMSNEFQTLD